MLKNLDIRYKLLLLPVLVAIIFAVVLLVVRAEYAASESRLASAERGDLPAWVAVQNLDRQLADIQLGLDDAVAARDAAGFGRVDELGREFLAQVADARSNPLIEASFLDGLETDFTAYLEGARREVEPPAVEGEGAVLDPIPGIEPTAETLARLRDRLKIATRHHSDQVQQAFGGVRAGNRAGIWRVRAVLVAGVLVVMLLALTLTGAIVRPLRHAVVVARRLSEGDLDTPIEVGGRDEPGRLLSSLRETVSYLREMAGVADGIADGNVAVAVQPRSEADTFGHAFRKMCLNLQQMIGDLKSTSARVLASSDQISVASVEISNGAENQSSATEETSSTMVEIASQIDSVARSSQALATNVEETSSSVQEMGLTIEQVAKNSESLLTAVEETSATIEEMTASVDSIADKVKVVDNVSRRAAEATQAGGDRLAGAISDIDRSSRDIGKIVRIIEEIADQTNLLALNAAIEAARAGDAGRGFAVVAEEVKRLAERSVESTREISRFVEAVQKNTGEAVEITQSILSEIVDSVAETTALVGEVSLATQEQSGGVAQILGTAHNMQDVTRQVAMAAKEQADSAREITRAVESMNAMTQQLAESSVEQKRGGDMVVRAVDQIAQIAHENLKTTEQLRRSAESLSQEARQLEEMAGVFKT